MPSYTFISFLPEASNRVSPAMSSTGTINLMVEVPRDGLGFAVTYTGDFSSMITTDGLTILGTGPSLHTFTVPHSASWSPFDMWLIAAGNATQSVLLGLEAL